MITLGRLHVAPTLPALDLQTAQERLRAHYAMKDWRNGEVWQHEAIEVAYAALDAALTALARQSGGSLTTPTST